MKKTTLGDRLQEVMQGLGIETPREFAKFCGVSEGLVSQWFSGTTKLGAKPLIALARTRFSLDWIVDGKLPKYSAERSHITTAPESGQLKLTPGVFVDLVTVYYYTDDAGREAIDAAIDAAKTNLPVRIGNELERNRLNRLG